MGLGCITVNRNITPRLHRIILESRVTRKLLRGSFIDRGGLRLLRRYLFWHRYPRMYQSLNALMYLNKMTDNLRTAFSNASSFMKMCKYWQLFRLNSFLRTKLTIQHWPEKWLVASSHSVTQKSKLNCFATIIACKKISIINVIHFHVCLEKINNELLAECG